MAPAARSLFECADERNAMDTPRRGARSTSQNMYHNENVGLRG
jgi:hypothetical protein